MRWNLAWLKYFGSAVVLMGLVVFIYFVSLNHQANLGSTQDVELMTATSNVGELRDGELNLSRGDIEMMLLLQVAETQKGEQDRTRVNFVFLDENDTPTNNDNEIASVQFEVEYLNKDDKVTSNSVERIEINELID